MDGRLRPVLNKYTLYTSTLPRLGYSAGFCKQGNVLGVSKETEILLQILR